MRRALPVLFCLLPRLIPGCDRPICVVAAERLRLGPLGEQQVGFARQGDLADIAGLVISNQDPEGIALDGVAFDGAEPTSQLLPRKSDSRQTVSGSG